MPFNRLLSSIHIYYVFAFGLPAIYMLSRVLEINTSVRHGCHMWLPNEYRKCFVFAVCEVSPCVELNHHKSLIVVSPANKHQAFHNYSYDITYADNLSCLECSAAVRIGYVEGGCQSPPMHSNVYGWARAWGASGGWNSSRLHQRMGHRLAFNICLKCPVPAPSPPSSNTTEYCSASARLPLGIVLRTFVYV